MNYENTQLLKMQEKIDELNRLLTEAKNELSAAKINEKLQASFNNFETRIDLKLSKENAKNIKEISQTLDAKVATATEANFQKNRTGLVNDFKAGVSVEKISQGVAASFVKQNEAKLVAAIRAELKSENLQDEINENAAALAEATKAAEAKIEAKVRLVSEELDESKNNYLKALENKSEAVLREYVDENKARVFKPFNLSFLRNDILRDKDFKKEVKETARSVVSHKIATEGLDESIQAELEKINKSVAQTLLNNTELKEQVFLNNLLLTNICITNELKQINKANWELNEFLNGKELLRYKIFKII